MEESQTKKRLDPLGWVRRHKKLVALLLVVILAAAIALNVLRPRQAANSYTFVRTTTLSKSSLTDSVSVNGTVASGADASVTVADSAKTYKVSEVRVNVGDKVSKGDVIAVLDTSDLEEQIATAEQNYSDDVKSAQTSYNRAVEDLESSTVKHENDLIDLQKKIEEADDDLDDAEDDLDDAEDDLDDAEDDLDDAEDNYDTIKAAYDTATSEISTYTSAKEAAAKALDKAQKKANELIANGSSTADAEKEAGVEDAKNAYNDAVADLESAQSNCSVTSLGLYGYTAIEEALSAAEKTKTDAESAVTKAEEAVEQARSKVESAEQSVKNAHDSYDQEKNYSNVTSKTQSVEDSATKLEQASRTPDNLKTLQDTLDECTLTATMDGTITGLNATVGSVCSGTVATIQNTDALVVNVTIPASEVSSLSTGMACRITSDATGDAEIEGTLTQIDPVANEQGSFGAEVTVTGENSGLLIGISAKVEIIISEKEDVFTVPRDAVGTADDGSSYVLRQTGGEGVDMTFEEVTVTTGDTTDYYVEISGDDLNEGDVIRSSADLTQGLETASGTDAADAMMGEGDFAVDMGGGDMPGGDMPGGGGGGAPAGGPGGM